MGKHKFLNGVKSDDSSGGGKPQLSTAEFWNSVKTYDSSGLNYTASKNKK